MAALTLSDLRELRSFNNPPDTVKIVVYALLALFGEDETWINAKSFLANRNHVMERIVTFDINEVTASQRKRLAMYLNYPLLTPEATSKASKSCHDLWHWLKTIQQLVESNKRKVKKSKRKKKIRTVSHKVEIPSVFQEGDLGNETNDMIISKAIRGLKTLTRSSLIELSSFRNPPEVVKLVCYALMTMFGQATTHNNTRQFLNQRDLFQKLLHFDVRCITAARAKRLRSYMNNKLLTPLVIKRTSKAALCLWEWVCAVFQKYETTFRTQVTERKVTQNKPTVTSVRSSSPYSQRNSSPFPLSCNRRNNRASNSPKKIAKKKKIQMVRNAGVPNVTYGKFLNTNVLYELRTFQNPPEVVKLVCFSMLALFGEETTWSNAIQFLNRSDLIQKLKQFNVKTVTVTKAKRIRVYMNNDILTSDNIGRTSKAALSLWEWICGVYNKYKMNNPTKRNLTRMKKRLQQVRKAEAASRNNVALSSDRFSEDVNKGLLSLTKDAIFELRSFQNPPEVVKLVCFSMLALFGEDTTWPTAIHFLNQRDLMQKLQAFDVHTISYSRAKRVRVYMDNDVMTHELISKTSKAALCLWEWVCAIYKIYKASNVKTTTRARKNSKKKKLVKDNIIISASGEYSDDVTRWIESLTQNALFELRSFQNPPEVVKLVCFSMLALFGEETTWPTAIRFLNQKDLMQKLLCFDVESITKVKARRLKSYMNNDAMSLEIIGKCSKAALCLWEWVCAVYNLYKKIKLSR